MIRRNIVLFKLDNFFGGLWPMAAVATVYFEQITHSYAIAMAVFSTLSIIQAVSEIPTGIYSDKIGRRKTLIFSALCMFFCLLFWAIAGSLGASSLLFLGAIFWGMSDSFMSGTIEALMYETMEETGKVHDFDLVFAQSNMMNQAGLACSMLIAAGVTYFTSLTVLAWVCLIPVIGQLVTAFLYTEPKKANSIETTTLLHFKEACHLIIKNKRLRLFALIEMLDSSVGMAMHRFEAVYFEQLVALWLINIARFLKQVCGAISFYLVPRVRHFGSLKILTVSIFGSFVVKLSALLINTGISPFLMSVVNLFYGISTTSKTELMQKEFSSKQRATMGSVISLFSSLFKAGCYLALGFLADATSVRFAIFMAVLLKLCVGFLCFHAFKKFRNT